MPVALYASPYPKLDLSLEEKEVLLDTANELVSEAQGFYESYLWKKNSTLDMAQWSLLREREDLRVFLDRRPGAGTGNKNMYLMLTVGTVEGTLHEAMYGEINHTTDAMRIKTAYIKDTLLDSAVLETILEPTEDLPFQSMSVRWFVKGLPLLARAVVKHRDMVYLEASGMKQLSNGEDIGFQLMHTIHSPKTPKLPMYERSNLSICTIWRQMLTRRVQVYRMAYFDIDEPAIIVPLAIRTLTDACISIRSIIECAQLKKLAYLVKSKAAIVQQDSTGITPLDDCSVCGEKSRSARRGVKSSCAICAKATCRKCRLKREIFTVSPDRQLLSLKMRFCTPCLASASQLDAYAVAQDEIRDERLSRRNNSWFLSQPDMRSTSGTSSIDSYSQSSSSC